MGKENLNKNEIDLIKNNIEESKNSIYDSDDLLSATSKLLSMISHQLAVVTQPFLSSGVFEKLEVFTISSLKLLLVITIKSGYVKTLIMEIENEIQYSKIERITQILNERLSGLTLITD